MRYIYYISTYGNYIIRKKGKKGEYLNLDRNPNQWYNVGLSGKEFTPEPKERWTELTEAEAFLEMV